MKELTVAVVGNPNSGKTTLFNALTGSTQRVGNWPGVTVEKKEGHFISESVKVQIVDLPGIYSLDAASEDERVSLDYILTGKMDLVLNILDATNLERNLYLTLQLTEMNVPLIVAVNMIDIADGRNIKIDLDALSNRLGVPVFGITATNGKQVNSTKTVIKRYAEKQPIPSVKIHYPLAVTEWLDGNMQNFQSTAEMMKVHARWVALRVLESTKKVIEIAKSNNEFSEKKYNDDAYYIGFSDSPELLIAESRYQCANDICNSVINAPEKRINFSDKIDAVVLNRIFGIPVFLIIMYLVFWTTLSIGGAFIDFFDIAFGATFVDAFGLLLKNIGMPNWVVTVFASGIGAGIQTVSTFVPIMFMMFLCLSLLEDSGYMSRAAFVMDRFMRAIGLPGKSFVPMLVGLGCSVPAVMASRTLDNARDRVLTIFMTPFMSCGARLPIYVLFGAAFFGSGAGLMVFSIYIVGGFLAVATGLLIKNTLLKGEPNSFIMELPPYHLPRPFTILRQTWNRLKGFLLGAGRVIIIMVAVLSFINSIGSNGSFGNNDGENSILSVIGAVITPIFAPMGIERDNWPAAVALVTGVFAKEAVVSTLNTLYLQGKAENTAEESGVFTLGGKLSEAVATIPANMSNIFHRPFKQPENAAINVKELADDGLDADVSIYANMRSHFNKGPFQVYAYLLFALLYMPCVAAMGAIIREIGVKLAAVLGVFLTLLAWIVSTMVYQIAVGRSLFWITAAVILMALLCVGLRRLGRIRQIKDAVKYSGLK